MKAIEELRAELSSALLAGELGIPADIPQHASYISNWLVPLRKDKREDFQSRRGRAEDRGHDAWASPGVCSAARTTPARSRPCTNYFGGRSLKRGNIP